MSSITQADLKLGGRLQLACDALAENKLLTAAGIFNEIGGDLNAEATAASMSDPDDWSVEIPQARNPYDTPENKAMCARGVHGWGPIVNGAATCMVCGMVNIAPKDPNQPNGGGGPIAMSFQ